MTAGPFRPVEPDAGDVVSVSIDGSPARVSSRRSVLAALLTGSGPQIDYFCAIGQCQRCMVRINGREDIACLSFPAEGDTIETPALWQGGRTPANGDQSPNS